MRLSANPGVPRLLRLSLCEGGEPTRKPLRGPGRGRRSVACLVENQPTAVRAASRCARASSKAAFSSASTWGEKRAQRQAQCHRHGDAEDQQGVLGGQ